MSPVAQADTLAVPVFDDGATTSTHKLRKQPSASRIIVSTKTRTATVQGLLPVASPSETQPAPAEAKADPAPKKQRRRSEGSKVRHRGRGQNTDSGSESATSISADSGASASETVSSSDASIDEGRRATHSPNAASDSEPRTLSDPLEQSHQEWSKLADEELTAEPLAANAVSSAISAAVPAMRGGCGGRGRGGRGAFGPHPPPPHTRAALAYLKKLEKDPSFTPRVGQFWSHDERLLDQDLRGLSSWWRGKGRGGAGVAGPMTGRGQGCGGTMYAGDFAPRGGRGGFRGGVVGRGGAVHQFGGRGRFLAGQAPPARKSKMAGWDDDESDVDDDALHGKSVRKVPASAQPVTTSQLQQAQPKPDMTGVPTAPRAIREAEAQRQLQSQTLKGAQQERPDTPAEQQEGWEQGGSAEAGKVSAWKAGLFEAQISPSLPPQQPGSTAELSSSSNGANSAETTNGESSSSAKAAGSEVSPAGTGMDTPSATASSKAATALPSAGFGKYNGPGSGMWAHDGFEALQHVDPRDQTVRGVRGGGARGAFGRGKAFVGFQGRIPFVPGIGRGRGGASFGGRGTGFAARGGRGGLARPMQPAVVEAGNASVPSGNPRLDGEKLVAEMNDLTVSGDTANKAGASTVKVNLPKAAKEPESIMGSEQPKSTTAPPTHLPQRPTFTSHPSGDSLPPSTSQSMSASSSASYASIPAHAAFPGQPPVFYPYPPHVVAPTMPPTPPMTAGGYPPSVPGQIFRALPQGCAVDPNGTVFDFSSGQPIPVGYYTSPPPAATYAAAPSPVTSPPAPFVLSAGRPAFHPRGASSGESATTASGPGAQRPMRNKGAARPGSVSIPASAAKVAPFRPGSVASARATTASATPASASPLAVQQHLSADGFQYYGGGGTLGEYAGYDPTGATYYPPYGYAHPSSGGYGMAPMMHRGTAGAPMYSPSYPPGGYGMAPPASGSDEQPMDRRAHYTHAGYDYGSTNAHYDGAGGGYYTPSNVMHPGAGSVSMQNAGSGEFDLYAGQSQYNQERQPQQGAQ